MFVSNRSCYLDVSEFKKHKVRAHQTKSSFQNEARPTCLVEYQVSRKDKPWQQNLASVFDIPGRNKCPGKIWGLAGQLGGSAESVPTDHKLLEAG